jgi:hypothetical protein
MNLDLIRHLSKQYDDGNRSPEATLASACLEAYQQGFDDGICEAEERMAQTQMLLMFTAGNA